MRHPYALAALLALPLATCCVAPAVAQVAAVPQLMNFQGRLTKPDGTPVADGTYSVTFSLFDAATGGTQKWSQTLASLSVRNGAFAALLSGFPAGTFNGNLWLQIQVGADAPLAPRQQLVTVAYAMKADSIKDGGVTSASLADGAVTSTKLAPGLLNGEFWRLGGNAGTTPTSQFLGTTDNQPLVFRTNNAERVRIDPFGRLGIGTSTPTATLDVVGDIRTSAVLSLRRNDPNCIISFLPQGGTGAREWWVGAIRDSSGIAPAGSFSFFDATAGATRLSLDGAGNIGVGISTPAARLHINGGVRVEGSSALELGGGLTKQADAGKIGYQLYSDALDIIGAGTLSNNRKIKFWNEGGATFTGGIGIATATPIQTLDVNGRINVGNGVIQRGGNAITGTSDLGLYSQVSGNYVRFVTNNGNFQWYADSGTGTTPIMTLQPSGELTASVVTITGGSDVAEPYYVANAGEVKPFPGMVVSIDPDHIGQMRVASRAYDSTVAGIISGANGIAPGITLRQKGTIADGEYPVASIGRVWVLCDTDANGSIAPGDLLTTSDTPGHAMKATDKERRDGAMIGKAMSSLKSGRGMVLVLVSLK